MIGILALALQVNSATPPATPPKPTPPPRARPIVVVDAGHGGPDRGMSGPIGSGGTRIREKDITLAVSKKLGQALVRRQIDVVYTRTSDTLIDLSDRGSIANKAGGALFISIHVNAASPSWRNPAASR